MNELALFAGAGGGILGGHLLGWTTVCAVERDAYAAQVLAQRQNDGILKAFPIWSDVTTFDGRPWHGIVDVISGGFPCQDISAAGAGAGIEGERSGLWSEFKRIIGEVRPIRVDVENSPMLTIRGLGVVLGDLAALGFDAEWGVISAADTGAPHLRERIWIVANARSGRFCRTENRQVEQPRRAEAVCGSEVVADAIGKQPFGRGPSGEQAGRNELADSSSHLADAESKRRGEAREFRPEQSEEWFAGSGKEMADAVREREREQGIIASGADAQDRQESRERSDRSRGYGFGRWPAEPGMGRVADGVANRVDRIKALGNGQVPRVVAAAWELLA